MSKIIDLFPPCSNASCTQPKPHKHILPKQQELFDSKEKYVALIGGYGSAKTLPTCVMGHLLSVGVPGNRGIIVRRSLPKLHDSTERIYLEVLKRSGVQYIARENRDGWPHRIIYGNGSEVFFRETKDLARFLGPEYGWFYIDEAQEEPEKTFKDLVGRLRLPRASAYLRGFLSTNPPSNQHWIARYWPREGAYKRRITIKEVVIDESFRMIRSSTIDNPHLDPTYVAGLMATHTPAEVKRIIKGQYGFSAEGRPVFTTFDELKHIGDPLTHPMTVYRVWDFGYNCPAVGWSQIFKCKKGTVHLNFLYELESPLTHTEDLAKKVIEMSQKIFNDPTRNLIVDGGDAAGAEINEKGPGPIIRLSKPKSEGGYGLKFNYRKWGSVDPGLDYIRKLLGQKCPCGYYTILFHKRCTWMIEAMAGGYHMPREIPGKDNQQKPVKDGYYDNIADVIRYTALLFHQPLASGLADVDWIAEAQGTQLPQDESPWSWMENIN